MGLGYRLKSGLKKWSRVSIRLGDPGAAHPHPHRLLIVSPDRPMARLPLCGGDYNPFDKPMRPVTTRSLNSDQTRRGQGGGSGCGAT